MNQPTPNASDPNEDLPPIMGTWTRLYWLVIIVHIIFIVLFYLLTQWYS